MAQAQSHPSRNRLITTFAGVSLGVLVVVVLYFAQSIFIPFALAVFLSFLMTPVVGRLEDWMWRSVAVVLTVVAAAGLLVGVGWAVTHEMGSLVKTLNEPRYAENISNKVRFVERWFEGGIVKEVEQLTDKVRRRIRTDEQGKAKEQTPTDQAKGKTDSSPPKAQPSDEKAQPAPAPVAPITPPWLSELPGPLAKAGEVLAQTALVAVLVVFILLRREDLRNRVIRLIGHGRLTVTTMALDDATARVSRYLFMQLVVNASYGLVFTLGLYFIGVPYAFLWGFLATVMRYVPYVGIWLAVLPPVALSLAVTPGWSMPLWVVGLVALLELVTANFVEPILFGQSIGVSEVALLISAAFWAWLWGPIGLILSAPLTVCLVVAGRYVPQLEFFDVVLGDAPVLPPRIVFYQRLLARDQDEAAEVVEKFARTHPPEMAYDEFLIPALVSAKRDREHRDLADADERAIVNAVAEIADEVKEVDGSPAPANAEDDGEPTPVEATQRASCLLVPARDETDEMALQMLHTLLDPRKWDVEVLPSAALAAELILRVGENRPGVVCVAALPPGGLAHTRYLCKRLRQRFEGLRIAVGLWGTQGDLAEAREALVAAGAGHVGAKLSETREALEGWAPVAASAQAGTVAPVSSNR
jgi:predicted PurR-regulated permease PerM